MLNSALEKAERSSPAFSRCKYFDLLNNLLRQIRLGDVLYVQVDSPELHGLPEDPQFPVLATIRQDILHPLSWIAWAAVAVILGTMVLVNRANRIRQEEEE